jgi:hypothetical protein
MRLALPKEWKVARYASQIPESRIWLVGPLVALEERSYFSNKQYVGITVNSDNSKSQRELSIK